MNSSRRPSNLHEADRIANSSNSLPLINSSFVSLRPEANQVGTDALELVATEIRLHNQCPQSNHQFVLQNGTSNCVEDGRSNPGRNFFKNVRVWNTRYSEELHPLKISSFPVLRHQYTGQLAYFNLWQAERLRLRGS